MLTTTTPRSWIAAWRVESREGGEGMFPAPKVSRMRPRRCGVVVRRVVRRVGGKEGKMRRRWMFGHYASCIDVLAWSTGHCRLSLSS